MTLRTRALLIVSGIAAFLVLAPLVIFFARGFRYDFENNRIIKTGTLAVKTEPRGADLIIGGKKNKTTPAVQRFLLPGEYELEIKKEGFRSWKKRVTILPEQVTVIRTDEESRIFLFFESPQEYLLPTSTLKILATSSPTVLDDKNLPDILPPDLPDFKHGEMIVTPTRQIFLLLDENLYQVSDKLEKINSSVKYARWENEADLLLYGNQNEIWIYSPLLAVPNELVTRSSKILANPVYNKKTGYVFFSEDQTIKAIELENFGSPNTYTFAETKNPEARLWVNAEGTRLIYLDDGELHGLDIR